MSRTDAGIVRALLAEQHPDLARLPIRHVARGWDNDLFRLGDDLAVRLPHRAQAAPLLAHELAWLPRLAPRLPLPVPVPLRAGQPGVGHPWPWSVVPWLPGRSALLDPPIDLADAATTLGRFFRAMHVPAPADAPPNPLRGTPLRARLPLLEDRLAHLEVEGTDLPTARIRRLVAAYAQEPEWPGPPVWVHGDPHAHNMLVDRGRLSAVVDFGDITAGDPASDLGALHSLLPAESLPGFAAAYGVPLDDPLWRRAAGWAVCLGAAVLGGPDETIRPMGRRLLEHGMSWPGSSAESDQ